MELFKKIRLKIGRLMLSKKAARTKREVFYSTFKNIKSIGIVWDASKPVEFASLSRFHQKMLDIKIDVTILGYYPGKNLPDQYTALRYLTCIRKDELNKFYHPDSSETKSFINKPFDVLIDINFDQQFPLSYVTELSKARLKVGLLKDNVSVSPFDLIMEMKHPVEIDSYLTEVIHYLEMIKDKFINTVE
jgi:hypothetical protein